MVSGSFSETWWTTEDVCGFLRMKRKAFWELRKKAGLAFPAPVRFGGKRNLYRAADVRSWAERQARGEAHSSECASEAAKPSRAPAPREEQAKPPSRLMQERTAAQSQPPPSTPLPAVAAPKRRRSKSWRSHQPAPQAKPAAVSSPSANVLLGLLLTSIRQDKQQR